MGLPEFTFARLCREVAGMAFQSGIKWYINLGKMSDYFNGGCVENDNFCDLSKGCGGAFNIFRGVCW